MSLLLSLIGLAIIGDVPAHKPQFKIRSGSPQRFEVIELCLIGTNVIRSFDNIRCAKAFRTALEWAIVEHDMNVATALLYATKRAEEELTAGLENDQPDEHFAPA